MQRFIASYSGGKDSMLAIKRAISGGLELACMLTMFDENTERNFFHGITKPMLQRVSKSIGVPIKIGRSKGSDYNEVFENCLREAKAEGVEVCVFGDIDIEDHKAWCEERCRNTGLTPLLPLWKESREALTYETIDSGFKPIIKVIDTDRMPTDVLGCILDREIAEKIREHGADLCGENGEYHTFVVDGPLFKQKIEYRLGQKITVGHHMMLDIT